MIYRNSLYFAWVIALAGAFLSLYYSEVVGLEPCSLCWYQRVALFPLVAILGIAAYRDDKQVRLYTLPLVFFGALAALYQWISSHIPSLQMHAMCGGEADCQEPVFTVMGFFTFPALSAVGFILIGWLLLSKKPAD